MKLKQYLEKNKTIKKAFAKAVGVKPRTLYDYIHEKIEPGLRTALLIRNETKNEVTLEEMVISKGEHGI